MLYNRFAVFVGDQKFTLFKGILPDREARERHMWGNLGKENTPLYFSKARGLVSFQHSVSFITESFGPGKLAIPHACCHNDGLHKDYLTTS